MFEQVKMKDIDVSSVKQFESCYCEELDMLFKKLREENKPTKKHKQLSLL